MQYFDAFGFRKTAIIGYVIYCCEVLMELESHILKLVIHTMTRVNPDSLCS